jgi:REP-associated tyrosine transposase
MFRISKDSPAYYLTCVAKDRLPVFRTDTIKEITCAAIDEARTSAGFLLFAYVLMPDHLHTIVGSELKPSKVLQFINGIVSHRVLEYLKQHAYERSLEKLRHADRGRKYRYSLWDHHPNAKLVPNEEIFIQKVNYIHQNPVRAGLVEQATDYRWSSARIWARRPLDSEPLFVDTNQILWRERR